jgi:chloramphenicol-sensitive protein RarD
MSRSDGQAPTKAARPEQQGFIAALAAYLIWGVSPIFFHSLGALSPFEVVAHRVVWSLVTITVVMVATGRMGQALAILRNPRQVLIFAGSALAITINWVVFVHAATTGHGLDASLGYYVFPLLTVVLAAVVLKERFSRRQGLALAIVVAGVMIMIIGRGNLPWITLVLAFSFGAYGSLVGLFVETLLLAPLALAYLVYQHFAGQGLTHMESSGFLWAMLVIGTPLWTGLPLFLFAFGARRLRLSTVGLMQYINPTCQFIIATLVFNETFTPLHAVVFSVIWLGIIARPCRTTLDPTPLSFRSPHEHPDDRGCRATSRRSCRPHPTVTGTTA